MPRLPELEFQGASPNMQKAMQAQLDQFGFVLNSTKVMGHCPDIAAAQGHLGNAIDRSGHIEADLRYLLYSKVATLNGCPF